MGGDLTDTDAYNTDDPLSGDKHLQRPRNRKNSARKEAKRGGAEAKVEIVEPKPKEDSEDDAVRPTKYVRLVDRKLTRVSLLFIGDSWNSLRNVYRKPSQLYLVVCCK